MTLSVQLCGLLLYALCASVLSEERVWHSTTTPPTTAANTPFSTSTTTTTTTTYAPPTGSTTPAAGLVPDVFLPAETGAPSFLPQQDLESAQGPGESAEPVDGEGSKLEQDVLTDSKSEPQKTILGKNKKPRKWISIPSEEPTPQETVEEEQPLTSEVDSKSVEEWVPMNETALGLPKNISDLLEAAEDEGVPMIQETIVSKKTTIYVTITESLTDAEPLYVNLTGIRDFTGQERRIVGGCLDLSDLFITGEQAKDVILRMSKHKFHQLDMSNNNISELPTNTFSPVAFTVRELRLDGNPLLSNDRGEGSMLQRGGLFHLTELRELNLSRCGLRDMDFFTPWNSNHLEVVDLSCNNLQTVPSNLQFFHKLKKLNLDGNPIFKVTELPFALLWNLQVLSMTGCLISSIASDPFRNMEHLKELSLDGNNLTRITDISLARGSSGVKMYLANNPWHCACDMLTFVEHYHYAIRDLEEIRCSSPRWLEGLRTAYLTKEILSLDSVDGGCSPPQYEVAAPVIQHYNSIRTDRLEVLALVIFLLAAIFMTIHVLCARRKDKYKMDDDRDDIHYIRIDKKPNFK